MKVYTPSLLIVVLISTSFIYPIYSAQFDTKDMFSSGRINMKDAVGWLHTDGSLILDDASNVILLRGICLYEVPNNIDHLKDYDDLTARVTYLKSLGFNHIRLPINKAHWDANTDTDGDGIGAKDFYYEVIDAFTEEQIYVFVGLHYGINSSEEQSYGINPNIIVDWYNENIINIYKSNPYVNIYVFNEPRYNLWGGEHLGGGIYSGYWDAMKYICQSINSIHPNILMIVHADMKNRNGLIPILRNDPIPTPNVVYTWHYYYSYGPTLNPYDPWMSGNEDPTYEFLARSKGRPFYKSYAAGNLSQARLELEQSLYDRFLWVPTELDLPIINDEFGFNGDEISHDSQRVCDLYPDDHWFNVNKLVDENGSRATPPYEGTWFCPIDGTPIPQPQPHTEPGWPQVMRDFIEIMEKYDSNWNYFAWWPKTYGGYGASKKNDMTSLNETGEILVEYLSAPN